MMSKETVQSTLDLSAKTLLLVHAGRLAFASYGKNFNLATPKIGEVVVLDKESQ